MKHPRSSPPPDTSEKKIQKYLAGEREGFSLVELIIVIAIMAILIGVIALAVIPNIGRSRESKDLQSLDQKVTTASGGDIIYNSSASNAVVKAVYDELGDIKLGSKNGDGKNIVISWTVSTNGAAVVTVAATSTSSPEVCAYTKAENGVSDEVLKVTSKK